MAKVEFQGKQVDPATAWGDWFNTSAFAVDKRLRHIFRILPHEPRCKFCNAPFEGIGGVAVRTFFGKRRSALNPRYCNMCDEASRQFPGGSEFRAARKSKCRCCSLMCEAQQPYRRN